MNNLFILEFQTCVHVLVDKPRIMSNKATVINRSYACLIVLILMNTVDNIILNQVSAFSIHQRLPVVRKLSPNVQQQQYHKREREHPSSLSLVVQFLQSNFDGDQIVSTIDDTPIINVNGNRCSNVTTLDIIVHDDKEEDVVLVPKQKQQQQPHHEQASHRDIQIVVLMNENARGVSSSTIGIAKDVFGTEAVFVTKTISDLSNVLSTLYPSLQSIEINKNQLVIVAMGGDGTLSTTIQTMCQILYDRNKKFEHESHSSSIESLATTTSTSTTLTESHMISQLPIIAYVPLGTGNAVGSVVGCNYAKQQEQQLDQEQQVENLPQRIYRQIRNIFSRRHYRNTRLPNESRSSRRLRNILLNIKNTIHPRTTEISSTTTTANLSTTNVPMIEITTTTTSNDLKQPSSNVVDLCFFAGVGFDSLMLDDFKSIKAWSQRTKILTGILSSVAGYCVTLIVKTLPKTVLRSSHMVNVQVLTNQINNTYWIDHRRGDFVLPCKESNLYDGITGIIAGSTVPYYGGKLRLFPFARISPDKLHLRIGRIHPLTGFLNIPKIFAGTYRDFSNDRFGVLDFIGNDFTVNVSASGGSERKSGGALEVSPTDGFPLQHSGESVGTVSSFRLRVIQYPVRFLNLLPER